MEESLIDQISAVDLDFTTINNRYVLLYILIRTSNVTLSLFCAIIIVPICLSFDGNSSIFTAIEQAGFLMADILALGELGVVSVLSFEAVVREDTAEYTCTASNALPQTTTLEAISSTISLTVLGELYCVTAGK